MPRLESKTVPQANRVLRLRELVQAVQAGTPTGLNRRDESYYRRAACILGLLDEGGPLTALGLELVSTSTPRHLLRRAFARSDVARAWMADQKVDALQHLRPESATAFLRRSTTLAESTVARRAITLRAWLTELTAAPATSKTGAMRSPRRLYSTPLTPDEIEAAEALLESLREYGRSDQVTALSDVILAALLRLNGPLERPRDVVTWLNTQMPSAWHVTIRDDLLNAAVDALEAQGYAVRPRELGQIASVERPTLVIEFGEDGAAKDATELAELLAEFFQGELSTRPSWSVEASGSQSRVSIEWQAVSTGDRPTAPVRVDWLRRPVRPHTLPLVRYGSVTHLSTLHHVAALALTCGEPELMELLVPSGVAARWSKSRFEGALPAYRTRLAILMDEPPTPGARPWMWWCAEKGAKWATWDHPSEPTQLDAALAVEPTGGPLVAKALERYGSELPPIEFGPVAGDTLYESRPPDLEHLVVAPTGSSVRLSIPAKLPLALRRDLVLHALGHILLGHVRPDTQTALWDTASTIRLGASTRPLDRDVQTTLADWFPSPAAAPLDQSSGLGAVRADPTPTSHAFLLTLRAQLALEPWHVDPYFGLRDAKVDPLPHQVSAVYDRLLPASPLRMMLADDPGAGKTIMAGLLIRERLLRRTLKRCLIVAPGGLVHQWQAELEDRFGLEFELLSTGASAPFAGERRLLLARLDQLARNKSLLAALEASHPWDLVVVDEAHKVSASPNGRGVDRTARYRLGESLRDVAEDLLLMTATPHNGLEGCFQLSLALLDRDRFCGPYFDPLPKQDTSDVLLRRVKEDLVRFDGSKLFPERFAKTVAFDLHPKEMKLYEDLTIYVCEEMNRVADADVQTANRVGFAMQVLQRRLSSSPRAIQKSLQRRRNRLKLELTRTRISRTAFELEHLDNLTEAELEKAEDDLAASATSARSEQDLRREIDVLGRLEKQANRLLTRSIDSKWRKLRELLDQPPLLENHNRQKLVLFTESRVTLRHVRDKLRNHLGRPEAVVEIHGGTPRKQRQSAVTSFMTDPDVKVLIANDAAGEGVNLQGAHFLVNYDLPWNPNRLEQRFGRIHRIGQEHTCLFYNLLASGTREGDVYIRLLEKLEVEREALGGRVYDVLGELFENRPLKEILRDATLQTSDAAGEVDELTSTRGLNRVLDRGRGLAATSIDSPSELKRRLDATDHGPFLDLDEVLPLALKTLGGRMRPGAGQWDVPRVPGKVQRRKDDAGHRLKRRYTGLPKPLPRTHPLARATVEALVEENAKLLMHGAVLEADIDLPGPVPAMLLDVRSGAQPGGGGLRLLAWHAGEVLDLRAVVSSLAPSASTAGLPADELDGATKSVSMELGAVAREHHKASLPALETRRRATRVRLERAIEEQTTHVSQLKGQRDRDAARARTELTELEARLVAAETHFTRLRTPPTTDVSVRARFTLVPRRNADGVGATERQPSAGAASESATPHEVQVEALQALALARKEGKKAGMVVMATGLGKTWLSAFDFQQAGARRGLFVAHRGEILTQAASTWSRLLPGKRVGFYDSEQKQTDTDLVFASVQTLSRRQHLQRFDADAFDYIVVDEFHHAAAASYRRLIRHFTPEFLLGMTATPDRTDGASLLALCGGNEIYRASLVQGISRRLLSPFHYFGLVSELDYGRVNWRSGRFDLDQLTELTEPWTAQAWTRFLERAGPAPRRTLVFCCTTRHADYVARFLRQQGVAAAAVHSKPSSADRAASLRQLRSGDLEAICCVDVFNEGVDLPEVDHVLMLRPTESPIVFLQQLGRGLRRAEHKNSLTVVDFIGNHRSFLLKPAVLMQLTGESPNPSASVQRLKQGTLRLPADCKIEVETKAIDLLEQLARRSPEDVLLYEYSQFWETHGRRPSAGELFAAGANLKPIADNHGAWFDFLASQGDLSTEEQRVLGAHRGWLDALWTLRDATPKQLPCAFPILAVQVMLDEDALCDELPVADVLAGAQLLAEADPVLCSEPLGGLAELSFWSSEGPAQRRAFTNVDGAWRSRLRPAPNDADTLAAMTTELVDLVLRRHRHKSRLRVLEGGQHWLLKVSHDGHDRPAIRLHRDKNPQLPQAGTILLDAEGTLYETDVVNDVLTVARPQGGGQNALPGLLRRWFGPRAGGANTRHVVRLEQLGTHFRLTPDQGARPLAQRSDDGSTELAFFPDQKAACGLHPSVDLSGAAPVCVPVAGRYDACTHFLVKADGDSMNGGAKPIHHGDLVLCRWLERHERDPAAMDGPCLLIGKNGGEPLVAIKTPERRDGQWWLRSANPAVPDMPVRSGMRLTPVARVLGRVEAELRFQLWRGYVRKEIAALFGSIYRPRDPVWDQGYVPLDKFGHRAAALFITLRKGRGVKKEHRYRDAFLSRSLFQWETQNRMGRRLKSGERNKWARQVLEHEIDGRQLHCFLQTQKREPFVYCGTLRYVDHDEPVKADGKHPMRCRMELAHPLPDRLWSLWGR